MSNTCSLCQLSTLKHFKNSSFYVVCHHYNTLVVINQKLSADTMPKSYSIKKNHLAYKPSFIRFKHQWLNWLSETETRLTEIYNSVNLKSSYNQIVRNPQQFGKMPSF